MQTYIYKVLLSATNATVSFSTVTFHVTVCNCHLPMKLAFPRTMLMFHTPTAFIATPSIEQDGHPLALIGPRLALGQVEIFQVGLRNQCIQVSIEVPTVFECTVKENNLPTFIGHSAEFVQVVPDLVPVGYLALDRISEIQSLLGCGISLPRPLSTCGSTFLIGLAAVGQLWWCHYAMKSLL